jgi:hypothetical protein
MIRKTDPTAPDIRRLNIMEASTKKAVEVLADTLDRTVRDIYALQVTTVNLPASPVGNLNWNGELGHSVNSWHDTAYVVNDKARECSWWFSHNKPAERRTFVDASVNVGADTIQIVDHGFSTGQTVTLSEVGGTVPAPLGTASTYYVIYVDADHIKLTSTLALALAGTPLDITSAAGGGTYTVEEQLLSIDARTSSTNNTLKTTAHTTYSPHYSRWDSGEGWGELTGTKSIDHLLPGNLIDATTPLARVSLIATRRSSYIEIPEDCLMGCGIWDNTTGQRRFLEGDIGFTAAVTQPPPATTVERRYRVLFTSDQGYSLLSPEITIANAPRDSSFSVTDYVSMSWRIQAGQLQVDIYEYLPNGPEGASGPEYRLLSQVSSATSYVHLGAYLDVVAGYPTATGTVRSATFFTPEGDLPNLNHVSAGWDTINFPMGVPNNYNKGNTTDRQWLRIWLSVAPNLFVEGITTDGSPTVVAPANVFDAEYDSLFDAGTLVAEVYDSNDTLLATTTVASRTNDTTLVLGANIDAGTNRKIRIVGGGFHGVYIDKIHLGYQQNTSYTPNPLDTRVLQPLAAPSSSTNTTVGTGGTGGGINTCVVGDTPVKQFDRSWKNIEEWQKSDLWSAVSVFANFLLGVKTGVSRVRPVRSANGVEIYCTDSEKFIVDFTDFNGTPLYRLRVGDRIMTEIDDRQEPSTIAEIGPYLSGLYTVYTPNLSNSHLWVAGTLKVSWWRRLLAKLLGKKPARGGFILHNEKPIEGNQY